MVALSSSTSSASTEPDSLPTLEEILAEPQRHFPRFLFDSEPLAVIELLNAMLYRCPERGHSAAIECLWCWQDLTDSSHSLSPLLEELRSAQSVQIVVAGLRLCTRLLQFAPNRVSRSRLSNEMDELHLDELMLTLRERFRANLELDEPLEDWIRTRAEMAAKPEIEPNKGADADSGTFSGGEEMGGEESAGNDGKTEANQMTSKNEGKLLEGKWDEETTQLFDLLNTMATNERAELIGLIRDLSQLNGQQFHQTLCSIRAHITSKQITANCPQPSTSIIPPPPPPPPPPPLQIPIKKPMMPPPPPPIGQLKMPTTIPMENNSSSSNELMASVPSTVNSIVPAGPTATADIPRHLRPKALPDQGRRLRHLQWAKVPTNAIIMAGGHNIWQGMEAVDRELRDRLDFATLDTLFGCPLSPTNNDASSEGIDAIMNVSTPNNGNGYKRRRSSMMPNGRNGHQKQDCISLLGPRRSLSVNVFLKMCRDTDQLLRDLAAGKAHQIGPDRLRTLAQLLPTKEEQKALCEFMGDKSTLGQAEQFLLALIGRIPEYRLRLEAMLFQLDLEAMQTEGTGLEPWLKGAEELMSSSLLRKVLYILLHLGNYLNHGAGAGNALGFRLNSLWKVEDVKAIGGKGRNTLLHFVAQQTGNCATELAGQLRNVREATKSSLEAIRDDVKGLVERMNRLEGILREKNGNNNQQNEEDIFFEEFSEFIQQSNPIIQMAKQEMAKLDEFRQKLATFFCEPERTFSLEECFKVVSTFVARFEKAVEENLEREGKKVAEDGANKLNEQKIMAKKGAEENPASTFLATFGEKKMVAMTNNGSRLQSARKSIAATILEERERGGQQNGQNDEKGRRKTLATTNGKLLLAEERAKRQNVRQSQNWPPISNNNSIGQQNDSLEAMVNSALDNKQHGLGKPPPVSRPIAKEVTAALIGNQPQSMPSFTTQMTGQKPQSALISISDGAKVCLATKKTTATSIIGGNGTKTNELENNQQLEKKEMNGRSKIKLLGRVRSLQGNAVVLFGGNVAKKEENAENGGSTPPTLKKQQTIGGILGKTNAKMLERKGVEGTKLLATSTPPIQRAKSMATATSPSITRATSMKITPQNGKPSQQSPAGMSTPKSGGTRPKPTLTRQVSTASRPALVNSGSSEKKPKWV